MLSQDQVEKNIAWLLANGSAPVKWLTYRHLLDQHGDSELMQNLRQDVENSQEVQEIFGKQEPDGSWFAGGSWAPKPTYVGKHGWDPYNPKYVTATWILPLLGEMGYTVSDRRIRKACDYVLSNGYFLHTVFGEPIHRIDRSMIDFSPCRFAQYMIALGAVGLADDIQAQKGYKVLLCMQREDGGWVLPRHYEERRWTRSCPWSTYHATMALYSSGKRAYREALIRGLEFLAWHLSTKEEHELKRFFYHGHSTVRELLMLTEFGVGLQKGAIRMILAWLMTMYDADQGCFRYVGKPISKHTRREDGMDSRVAKYRLYHLIEDDWFTLHMTRIGKNLIDRTPTLAG